MTFYRLASMPLEAEVALFLRELKGPNVTIIKSRLLKHVEISNITREELTGASASPL